MGCSSEAAVKTLSEEDKYKDLQPPETGPVGEWDIPLPEINPLGSQALYTSTDYAPGSYEVSYIDNFAENKLTLKGEVWTLLVNDPSGAPLYFLKKYAEENQMKIFTQYYGNRLTFQLVKDEDSLWWGDAQADSQGYILRVVKELRVPVSKEKKFTLADLGPEAEEFSFTTSSSGKRFQSATLKLPEGNLDLLIYGTQSSGSVTRSIYEDYNFSSQRSKEYIIDDLPQGEGDMTWIFSWGADARPTEFSFLLTELQDLPPVKLGDELGALKVSGVPFGDVVVEPQKGSEILHIDDYSLRGDITPEGDTLFWLPSGLWNLALTAESAGLENSKTRLIPVNAGETTTLTLPTSLKSAYTNLNTIFAAPEDITGGIEILETKDSGNQATISMLVNDPQKRDIFPSKENTLITEGGKQVEITDITRQITPPSIVLVLDSSGSMQKEMTATVQAAKKFISGLPDKTYIKVVDFDTNVKVLPGETKEAVVNSLSSVVAEGSTVLFDATLEGLHLLENKARPTLVVFADGADSSLDGQGVGSNADKEQVLEKIKEAKIPIFTIGFGQKPDATAMKEFSAASSGRYFSAKDEKALTEVFSAISGTFGNSFVMTYNRPKEASFSDTPVVSLVLDASGSMDTDPAEEEGCDFRMDKTKILFHDFIQKLPSHYLTQLTSFQTTALGGPIIRQGQITTQNKSQLLQSLGELDAGGGTPILMAITIAYENIRSVPSNKKAIVFLTDAALEVDEEERAEFEQILAQIKKENIAVLWAGIGVEEHKEVFAKAAQLSGGSYIVTEEANGLQSSLADLLASIETMEAAQELPLSIQINDKSPTGTLMSYAANTNVNFKAPPKSSEIIAPDGVQLSTGTPLKRYDSQASTMVTGRGIPGMDTILTKRIPFTNLASNKAMELSVKEAYYFSKFKGLEPPAHKQFLALELQLKNVTPDKIPYSIPSITSHFYVNINNEGSYPASQTTWLTETPLSLPGEPGITLPPKKELAGTLVFLVPDDPVTQTSLHFYDLVNEHIHLPLIGKMDVALQQLDQLPVEEPAKITDAFSIAVTASRVVDKVDIYPTEEQKDRVYQVVEADFSTKVQALLDINPRERLWLRNHTANGPLLTPMSEVTTVMPLGFASPVMLAPSSTNKVRLAYPMAKALSGMKADLWGDVKSGSLQIPVVKGNPYGKAISKATLSGDGLQIKVNQATTLKNIEGYGENWVIADVTFSDTKDGFGTQINEDFFQLIHKDYLEATSQESSTTQENTGEMGLGNFGSGEDSEGIINPSGAEDLLYGIQGDWAVYDGEERRGFVLFLMPDSDGVTDWTLTSPYMEKLNQLIGQEAFADAGLLVEKEQDNVLDNEFETLLAEAVNKVVLNHQSLKAGQGTPTNLQRVTFSQEEGKKSIPKPSITTHGAQKLNSVTTIKDFTETMKSLRWLPSKDTSGFYRYSPEAVLTQGWGTDWDLTNLAMGMLARSGSTPQYRTIALTEEGKTALQNLPKAQAEEQAKAITETSKKGILGFFSNLFAKILSIIKPEKEVAPIPQGLEEIPSSQAEEEITDHEEEPIEESVNDEGIAEEPIEEEGLQEEEPATEEGDEIASDNEKVNTEVPEGEQESLPDTITGISYQTPEGESKLFVIPFMKDISELEGLVYIPHQQETMEFMPVQARIRVSAMAETSGLLFQDAAGDIADALGGDSGEDEKAKPYEYITLLDKEVSLPSLSLDAIEIGYLEAGTGKGKRYAAALFTTEGVEAGQGIIDTGEHPLLGVSIEISLPGNTLTHESPLKKGEALNTLYHTLAINLPDLPDQSVKVLEEASEKAYKSGKDPDSLSILKWYSRNILERFIANQTTFDEEQQAEKGLLLGRTDKERCIVLTSRMGKDNTLYSTIDLLQVINQVHNGNQTLQAGYNIFAGLYASSLESAVLTGENKAGYQELWSSTPEGTSMILIPDGENRELALDEMRKAEKYPDRLLDRIENTTKVILVPDQPGVYQEQKRWAWLEIDPATYETISVIDTGEHAGMASYAMSLLPSQDDYGQFIVGALIGVDIAVWAVCSSSLKLSDYKEILADAQALALSVGVQLDNVMKGYSAGRDQKLSVDGSAGGFPLKIFGEISKDGFKTGIGQNIVGFSDGFKAGVSLYFASAKPKSDEPGKPPKK
ncbi:Mg-chelatase subunit ChlD [Desulfitobacterium dichloroeliminans LMG P-21439]|uniref:Mg-chelatase subunit ChlD n=2 Tax=Desulfitobacterium dichloroeliminans TaxID=233055 RepID=L0F498_DESDL|nr:Mg-chelatase subunit ChlD [Desulfitobacterium dichloroeliminans LMG P-21439]